MTGKKADKRLAILGAGPSGLFIFKQLVEARQAGWEIHIFEAHQQLGAGMPYSKEGACREHVTNVSGNEVPPLVTSLQEWLPTLPEETLKQFNIDPTRFTEYKVVPRLLFGQYLAAQFELVLGLAARAGLTTRVHSGHAVTDIQDDPRQHQVNVIVDDQKTMGFDCVILCTGHYWPKKHEGRIPHYFDSPYPPSKLAFRANHPVAIKGASLTAIDAIRTLARQNGQFTHQADGTLSFQTDPESPDFKLILHSRNGLLPAIRFHLEEPLLSEDDLLTAEQIATQRAAHDGFLPLDYVFETAFKAPFRQSDPGFYERIRTMNLETFVESVMEQRERQDPFELFTAEYAQAEQSIRRHQSMPWKEQLAVLSYVMNYPAKYFSAEDNQRLQNVIMPLISLVIAFVPQSSAQELLALHQAGVLTIRSVGADSSVEPQESGGAIYRYSDESNHPQADFYATFVDCTGQAHLSYEDFPFKSLLAAHTVSPAFLKFRSAQKGAAALKEDHERVSQDAHGAYWLKVPGVAINDNFQILAPDGTPNPRLFIMAVPFIGGYNPDYSGLDFCQTASKYILEKLLEEKVVDPVIALPQEMD
ncbi:FAD/NAD(P)-binding protein [Larkinella harenae]